MPLLGVALLLRQSPADPKVMEEMFAISLLLRSVGNVEVFVAVEIAPRLHAGWTSEV